MSDEHSKLSCTIQSQGVHLLFPLEQLLHRVEIYEQEFAKQEAVTVIDWGCSYKQEQGYMVLEWDGEVDLAFLQRLDADPDVFDYCVYSVPCMAFEGTLVQDVLNVA